MLKKFADELKDARIKSGITLSQIHTKTRIDIKFLEDIEAGNFEVLPEVYLRAFIRAFATSVDLDEVNTMKRYDAAKSGKLINEKDSLEPNETKEDQMPGNPKKAYTGTDVSHSSTTEDGAARKINVNPKLLFLAGVVLTLVVIIYLFFIKGNSNEIITERPYDEILNETKQRYEAKTGNDASPVSGITSFSVKDSLTLLIKAKDTAWIGVKLDNSGIEQDFILYNSNQKKIKAAKNFLLTIGNSKNVELYLNEKSLGFIGGNKEVKLIKIDSTGLTYITPIKKEIR
ncbi:MAG: DUF4115 domain-containing protein [Ignavibacteriales bacterium]|nr:DUF4115 domain-containing protein [Ignavibacteriales bacterium]